MNATTGLGTAHNELYFARMAASLGDKARLLDRLAPGNVLDVGAGEGSLVRLARADGREAIGIDASPESVLRGQDDVLQGSAPGLRGVLGAGQHFDNIIACSVLHEIFSYAGQDALEASVAEMASLLRPGGRLVIRDGVGPDDPLRPVMLRGHDLGAEERFFAQWHELSANLGPHRPSTRIEVGPDGLYGPAWAMTSYVMVRVWGRASLVREAQEAYTCAGMLEARMNELARWSGLRPVHRESYTQPGHLPHFERIGTYRSMRARRWVPRPWPATNAIWVLAKG